MASNPAPRTIDGYDLIRELGRGGMGVVYEVHDPKLGRPLALKLMLQGTADAESLLRFSQEAELLARINHPNVVRIHRVGRSAEGPYIAIERVEGTPLDRVLGQGELPPEHAAAVVRDLASAVATLHAAGIVHRDLKLQNVILRADATPVLIDFGLARDERAERLTATGSVMGTFHTMSPEQARGDTHRVGPASDVYGLGVVLFALLTGAEPFVDVPKAALFAAITQLDPPWPADAEQHIPPPLKVLCRRAMAKDPEARPDADALKAELERFLRDAPPPAFAWPLALAAGSAIALVLLAALYAVLSKPGERTSHAAVHPAPTVPAEAARPEPLAPSPTRAKPSREEISRVCKALRGEPPQEILREARELLAGPGGSKLLDLRRAYVSACLQGAPVLVSEDIDLPARGLARWFDDERLVLSSRTVRALWRWSDCREDSWERVDFTAGGIPRNTTPEVFGSEVFIGGGEPTARGARCYPWDATTPSRTFATETLVTSIAAWGAAGTQQLLAVGTEGTIEGERGTILIFDLRSNERVAVLRGHRLGVGLGRSGIDFTATRTPPEVRSLCFSRDGRWLVSGGYAGDLIVWDVTDWTVHEKIELGNGSVEDITLHPSQPLIAVCPSKDRSVRILRIPGLVEEWKLPAHVLGDSVGARFSRDGRLLFAGSGEAGRAATQRAGELLAYDLQARLPIRKRSFRNQALNSVDLSLDGRRLVTYSQGAGRVGILQVWEIDVPPGE